MHIPKSLSGDQKKWLFMLFLFFFKKSYELRAYMLLAKWKLVSPNWAIVFLKIYLNPLY